MEHRDRLDSAFLHSKDTMKMQLTAKNVFLHNMFSLCEKMDE